MGNKSPEQNKKPFRWFEYKSYDNDNNDTNSNQSYYNNLIQNKGYLIPLSIDQCANLEKQLNLNNEGLSTKYFFKYDYKDKLLTVEKNGRYFKRLKTPVVSQNYTYKIKRYKRFYKNTFKLLKPNSHNFMHELGILFYNDIFKEFKIDENDKFILKFTNHCTIMNKDLINTIKNTLIDHLKKVHYLSNDDNTLLNFDKLKQILIKDFKTYKNNKQLSMYPKYFLKNICQENFESNIIQMIIEEGELINIINNIYESNISEPNIFLYLLCLKFSFDNKCSNKEIVTTYKILENNVINKENFIANNFLMNFGYMSVSKDRNIFNMNSNIKDEDNNSISNKIIIQINYEVPMFKNWYLSFKALDTECISQYPIEKEIIIQPYSIFEILEVNELPNNNIYVQIFMKSNILNELTKQKISKQMQMNLGFLNDIGDNINQAYPDIDLDKILSMNFNNKNNILKNKEKIGCMKNLRVLDLSNINLTDADVKQFAPFMKNFINLHYINLSLNNLSHKSLELLEEIIPLYPFLEHIVLDQNTFGNEGIIALSKGLKKIDNLKSFSSFFNQIRTDGIDALSKEIKRYKNLYYLNLSTNYVFYEEIDELVSSIKYMNNLIELNLSNNQISSEGLCFIGEILPKTIQKLNFSENEIYQDGFCEFGSYLCRMPNLISLIIYGNRNGPSGISSLLDGFEYCPLLDYLDFGCTRIEDCDVVLILKKIRKIKNIKSLIIKENYLTDDSVFFLLQCINILTKLEMLDISWNTLEGVNLVELFGLLTKNERFRLLNIEGNPCESKVDIKSLLDILNKNCLIQKKEQNDNINDINNNDDYLWKYENGKFIKKNKYYSQEKFVNNYLSDSENTI